MRRLCLVALSLAWFHPAIARAGDPVVIESYGGKRPDDATRSLQVVYDELAARKFVSGADVVGRKFERISRPAITAAGLPADFAQQVDNGHRAWIAGRFDEALKLLTPMVDLAHGNPGAFAKNPNLRDRLMKALIALALSQQRTGDPSATKETFREILRSFDTSLSRSTYGPDAYDLFEQVRKELAAGGKGTLLVKERSGGAIYVNERFVDVGEIKLQLFPGEYRVFAKLQGDQLSRAHRVVVTASEETRLAIDIGFDSTVHSTPAWTGLAFASAGDREKLEPTYAAAFANAIDAQAVAVIGIDQVRGRPVIFGALVNLYTGRDNRRAAVALDPDPPVETLRGLARFLAGEPATPGVEVQVAGDGRAGQIKGAEPRPDLLDGDTAASSRLWPGWKYVTGGLGLAAIGAGAILIDYSRKCTVSGMTPCAETYNTGTPGWISIGGGAVLVGVAVYLVIRGDGPAATRTAFVIPTRGGAVAGYTARF